MHLIPHISTDFLSIVFIVFLVAVFLQLLYLFLVPFRLLIYKQKNISGQLKPVSIIICARNEEDNLVKNLPLILDQHYHEFEVIVVNDQSVDDSGHLIKAFQKTYPNLKLIELERNKHRKFGKKIPLTVGIKGAKYEHLLLIDADCRPTSNNWAKEMMQGYVDDKSIVIGYGPYQVEKGVLNKLIRFDTTAIASTYMGMALMGRPYMGVGRNLSYTKQQFFDVLGFKKHYHIQSGDDDLFMQEAANGKNVSVSIQPESFVYSEPKRSWKAWVRQKQRHYTTATEYRLINKIFLGIFPMSMLLMLFSFFILMFYYEWWLFVLLIFGLRFVFYWLINGLLFRKLKMKDLVAVYPLIELVHFFLMPFIYYSSDRTEKGKW
ncbi:glycosyltransferase [Crocinitomix catalasitica]|uniref:glycosyltransferase n=1 Tax=Crocinitomix catalasitica TaxID=184607 RepID=UPI000687A0A4|nr:glycosyltransferase [Crocinitomix catalasitica]